MARVRHLPVCTLLLSACAANQPRQAVPAGKVTELESLVSRERTNLDARVDLAAAYLKLGRNQDAAALLEGLIALPEHPTSAEYFLGVAYEGLNRVPEARQQYQVYLERGTVPSIKRVARGRIAAFEKRELEQVVKAALAREQSLAGTNPTPRTIGVFPFLNGGKSSLAPLGRAFAELLTTDLSQTDRLVVVERAQVQRLLDEVKLGQSGLVDPQSAARAGRLLGAGRIVQGRLAGDESTLRVEVLVASVATGEARPSIVQQGALRGVMTLQNNLALDIYASFGIQLTAAERERVMRRPTQNVQALLAFGFGLEAEDSGRYREAVERYQSAVKLDPSFVEASVALDRAQARADAADDTPQSLAADGAREFAPDLLRVVDRWSRVQTMVPNPGRRDPVSEVLGTEGFERRGLLDLTIRRPR
ncbi:MAG: tetratricopeptide repeat protein [Longimicrobiales bacterium]